MAKRSKRSRKPKLWRDGRKIFIKVRGTVMQFHKFKGKYIRTIEREVPVTSSVHYKPKQYTETYTNKHPRTAKAVHQVTIFHRNECKIEESRFEYSEREFLSMLDKYGLSL